MSNKRARLNLKPPWLTGTSESIKAEAIRLYSMNSKVLEALTATYIQTVLKALGVRRAHFVAYALVLASAAHPAAGGGPNPSLVCAGSNAHGQERACGYGEAAV
jgi:hypothetical protein